MFNRQPSNLRYKYQFCYIQRSQIGKMSNKTYNPLFKYWYFSIFFFCVWHSQTWKLVLVQKMGAFWGHILSRFFNILISWVLTKSKFWADALWCLSCIGRDFQKGEQYWQNFTCLFYPGPKLASWLLISMPRYKLN